jgi:hypothetical protein
MTKPTDGSTPQTGVSRRQALRVIGAAGAGSLLAGTIVRGSGAAEGSGAPGAVIGTPTLAGRPVMFQRLVRSASLRNNL